MKSNVGRNSLIVTSSGFIAMSLLIHFGFLESKGWLILLAGFEAGTIGGFADWFAVRALFHEIPIPFIKRHTNIIVNNRRKLTDGMVDLVTNKWLTPEVLKQKIAGLQMAKGVLETLQVPSNKIQAVNFLRRVLDRFADNLDQPEIATLLQKILKDQIANIDIANPLGHWLENAVKTGSHNQLWEMILEAAQRTLNARQTQDTLLVVVREKIKEYKDEGWAKKAAILLGEKTGAIDERSIVSKLTASINDLINDAKNNPTHQVRQQFDNSILEFARKLIAGEKDSQSLINNLKNKLIENTEGQEVIQGILGRFKYTVKAELASNDSAFMEMLIRYLEAILDDIRKDESKQDKIDIWLKGAIIDLITKYHEEIGNMVNESLSKLNDTELTEQIESKAGKDLQYIRLNGAIVGGLVGILLAILKLFCFQ